MTARESLVSAHHSFLLDGGPARHAWLDKLRSRSINEFGALGIPSTKLEDWRFTNLAPLAELELSAAVGRPPVASIDDFNAGIPGLDAYKVVMVNGIYCPELSSLGGFPSGVTVTNLAYAIDTDMPGIAPLVMRNRPFDTHHFRSLNSAFVRDGAFIRIGRGVDVDKPILLVFVAHAPSSLHPAIHPRNIVVAEESSRATIIESYAGLDGEVYLTNALTQIHAMNNAHVDHYRVQRESRDAFHVSALEIVQQRDSSVSSQSLLFGARICRADVDALLDGPGAQTNLNGLYATTGSQLCDAHMLVDHAKPHCESHELYKGVLRDDSRGVFSGRIVVRPDAQKTNARQTNNNLLFDRALANSNPQLEIFADDVKCTHGSTTGRLDDTALFYLRSRGIAQQEALDMLTYAFACDVIGRIRVEPLRAAMERELLAAHGTPALVEVG